ncbi:MAG TPA: hypothetical protein VK149_05140 [Sideroxyarcus sp.]|nr:hypothetical protein [Sideroxyarcus sp.]
MVNQNLPGRPLPATTALIAALLSAQAAAFDSGFEELHPPAPAYKDAGFHFVVREGITGGGDAISSIPLKDGSKREISAGGINQIGFGTRYRMSNIPLSIALSINYHYDYDYHENDNADFRRVPLEALAYLDLPYNIRLGGGLRHTRAARANSTINGISERITFHNTRGSVVEIGYHVLPYGWVDLRYVKETYQVESYTSSGTATQSINGNAPYNGSHVGLFITLEN